jgi:hypothetical protein
MAVEIGTLQVTLSGGAANEDPNAGLGGEISTAAGNTITSQSLSSPVNVVGVTLVAAFNNTEGSGTLRWENSSGKLYWRPPGDASEYGEVISGTARYRLGSAATGFIIVDTVFGSLPSVDKQDTVSVTNTFGGVFDNITPSESLAGSIEYRCIYVKNVGAGTAFSVKVWIKQQPTGPDTLAIALSASGVGDGTATGVAEGPLADETDSTNLLVGLSFTAPADIGSALLVGDVNAGQSFSYWEERTIAAGNTTQELNDTSTVSVSGSF